ncbi:MAG: HAMP domain-containing sensor histidine kinase [Candidatus Spechtbacterales bacterium]
MNRFVRQIFFWKDCRQYGVSIWACPSFLFLLIGFITIVAIVATYIAGTRYSDPYLIPPLVILVTLLIFIPGTLIVRTFEKMAQTNKMKTEFVSITSHQLRSPLSSIKWSLDLLLNSKLGQLDARQQRYLHVIQANNEQMLKLVNDLLNVSRADEGRLVLRKDTVDVHHIVEEVVKEFETTAQQRNITIRLEMDKRRLPVRGDETYLEMVVVNFLDNAVRYTKGSGEVIVRLFAIDSTVRFEVEDRGVGIPAGDQELIFKKFFRSQNAVRHQTEGTGLGLFIARAVILGLKGRIGFTSQEGKGSIFWFELPAIT